jgi:hypothetical protein
VGGYTNCYWSGLRSGVTVWEGGSAVILHWVLKIGEEERLNERKGDERFFVVYDLLGSYVVRILS